MHIKVNSTKNIIMWEDRVYWHSSITTILWALSEQELCIKKENVASRVCRHIGKKVNINNYVRGYVIDYRGLKK